MTPTELQAARQALGLSQAELARRLGVPTNTLHLWERGTRAIRHGTMLRLALSQLAGRPCFRCGLATAVEPTILCLGCYDATAGAKRPDERN